MIRVFDFRYGLREDLALDVLQPGQSPSLRNCRFLPRGRMTKRRALWFRPNPTIAVMQMHASKLLEMPAEDYAAGTAALSSYFNNNEIPNAHFGLWTSGSPNSWTTEAGVVVTQSGSTDIVSVVNGTGGYAGIYSEVFSKVSGDPGSRMATNIYSVSVRQNLTLNKNMYVALKDGAGNTLKTSTIVGTGAWATSSFAWANVSTAAGRCYLYLQPEDGGTALIHYVKFRSTRQDFFCFGQNNVVNASVTAFLSGSTGQAVADVTDTLANLEFDGFDLYAYSLPIFKGRIQVFPQISSTYKSPFELDITSLVKYRTSNTGYLPPSDWNNSDANGYPYFPRYLTTFDIEAGQLLVGANSLLYPNRLWWSEVNNQFVWSNFENPGFGGPGFMDVGSSNEPVTGVMQYRSSLLVFKRDKTYAVEFDENGARVTDVIDIGTPWHHSIVSASAELYFYSTSGFVKLLPSDIRDNRGYGWEIISAGIERTHRAILSTLDVHGVYDKINRRILWFAKIAAYDCYEYYIDWQSWVLSVSGTEAQFTPIGADWSDIDGCVFMGSRFPIPTSKRVLLWDYPITYAPNEQSVSTESSYVTAMDFFWSSNIIHGGELSKKKKFTTLRVYYNALASNPTYPFTVVIDRNPMLNDDSVISGERYIRIRSGIEIGDGTTFTATDTTNGIQPGDITGAVIDITSDPTMKVFKYYGIGECNSIQIEFSDNRVDTDFIIFGFEVE